MRLKSNDANGALIGVSWDELAIIKYAIGDAIQKIDDWEFPILVGAPVALAKALHEEISRTLALEPVKKAD